MAARLLTINPFELPDGSNPEVELTISLVDSNNRRLQGLTTIDGQPVIDRFTLLVHQDQRTAELWPQPELVPVIEHGSNADQNATYYLVDIVNRRTRYRQQIRTTVDSGGSLSWSEFINGAGPLEGGELPGWMTHIADAGIHVPAAGLTGQSLIKQSDTSGDTVWATVSGGGGGGEANVGVNVGGGTPVYRDKTGVGLNFHTLLDTPTVDVSLANDAISMNVPAGQFDVFGSAQAVQGNLTTHATDQTNPHVVTKAQVGLGLADNTADANKPVSGPQQAALDLKADSIDLLAHEIDGTLHVPPGGLANQVLAKIDATDGNTEWQDPAEGTTDEKTKVSAADTTSKFLQGALISGDASVSFSIVNPGANEQLDVRASGVGGGESNEGANVGVGTDIFRDKSGVVLNFHRLGTTATVVPSLALDTISFNVPAGQFDADGSAAAVQVNLDTHVGTITGNPHSVTKNDVGLGLADNTADINKPISVAQQAALDLKANDTALTAHTGNTSNPHSTTKTHVGLGNVDNTSDLAKPISTSTQAALNLKADDADLSAHEADGTLHVPPGGLANQVLAKIDAVDGNTEWQDPAEGTTDEQVKVSAADTTPKFLQSALTSGDASVIFSIINPGLNEQLDVRASGVGGGESNEGANVGTGVDVFRDKSGVVLNFHRLGPTATVVPSLATDTISLNVPGNTFDAFGDAAVVQSNLDAHVATVTGNPHAVTKADVGLSVVDNTPDANKPVSVLQQAALDLKADLSALTAHTGNAGIHVPSGGLTAQVLAKVTASDGDTEWIDVSGEANLGANVGTGVDIFRDKTGVTLNFHRLGSTATVVPSLAADIISFNVPAGQFDADGSAAAVQSNLDIHIGTVTGNPHAVTKAEVGLGNADNTSDVNKPVSVLQQAALDLKADLSALTAHTGDAGIHVPSGGLTAQVLAKATGADGDTEWVDPSAGGGGEANLGANVGAGVPVFRDKTGVTLNFHQLGSTATVVPSLGADTISFNVPAGQFDADGSADAVQSNLDTHIGTVTGNPHGVTKAEVGLGNADNTSDADKPVSVLQQAALDTKLAHSGGTLTDVGETAQNLGNVSGAVAVNISAGQSVQATLTGNATGFTITNPTGHSATSFALLLVTGGFDVTSWAPSVAGWFGAAPDLSSGGTHGFAFELIGGSWYGTHKGLVV